MSPAVDFDFEARGEHPVMSGQCSQRLPVIAGGLLALFGLSLAESPPGDRLGSLARFIVLQDLAGRRGNLRRRVLQRGGSGGCPPNSWQLRSWWWVQWDKFKFYSGPVPQDYVLNERDLLVTMTDLSKAGDTLGYPALFPRLLSFFIHRVLLDGLRGGPPIVVELP